MVQFQIQRTGRNALVFEGVKLCDVVSERVTTDAGDRWFSLAVYQKNTDGYVVTIEFATTCESERAVSQAEDVDQYRDVEEVFLAFEPWEFIDRRRFQPSSSESLSRFNREIYRVYDRAFEAILEQLRKTVKDSPCGRQA